MIEKINSLKSKTENKNVQALCQKASASLNSGIYESMPSQARVEFEKAIVKNLFEGLSSVKDEPTQEWLKNTKRLWEVRNLGVRDAINTLMDTEAKENASLKESLNYFEEQLESQPEALLYESFISAMQSFHYFPKVGNAIKAIKDRVDTYESDVSITKIMETMKKSRSSYLVPVIEDLVQNYLDDKNTQTKSSLKEGLIKFSYDPFVRDLINLVTVDATNLQLEYANATCDMEKVYSPVLYLGENEAVFGVRGSYYVKKGNTLSKLNNESVKRLDKEFVSLCERINDPNIVIDGKSVTIYEGSDKAVISDKGILVNNQEFTNEEYKNSAEIANWTGKGRFLSLVETFRKNFHEIAEVDFAKRVFLKENTEYAADIFKLRGNISIATYNPEMGKGTFYRNINPIQAKNLMMEHLRFDVSKAFSDLLPNEEKINEEIIETRKEYTDYIIELQNKIQEFRSNPFAKEVNEEVIAALQEELDDIKNEYKDYLNLVEAYMRLPKEDLNEATISLEIDGPLQIEVGGQKYTVPIPAEAEGEGEFDSEFGTEVGAEDVTSEPASAVTFDDVDTELLGDSPTIASDEVSLGADQIEADADAAEADVEMGSEEGGEDEEGEGGEIEGEGGEELGGDEGEIKVGDEEELDLGDGEEEKVEDEEEEKIEDSTMEKTGTKKRVYLKKKKK